MRKYILLIILIISIHNIFGQELLFKKEVKLRSINVDQRESLPVINNDNNEITLFLLDEWFINVLLLNSDYNLNSEYSTSRPEWKYQNLLGYSYNSEGYHLFFANEMKIDFYCKTINIKNKESKEKPLFIEFENEKFIESFSYKNNFYIVSIEKMTSLLKIYKFEGNEVFKTDTVDLSGYKFSNSDSITLFDLLNDSISPEHMSSKIHKNDCGELNSLEFTSKQNKIFCYNDMIYITLDNMHDNTILLSIDLNDYTSNMKIYNHRNNECDGAYSLKTNSYLFDDILYQLKGCKNELYFSAYNIQTDSLLNHFKIRKHENTYFRNKPSFQEGGTTYFKQSAKRKINNAKRFLHKLSTSDNIGLNVYQLENGLEITIGGYLEIPGGIGGGGMVMTSPGATFSTPKGTVGTPPTYQYDPTLYGSSKNPRIRTVYFKTLLNEHDLSQIDTKISMNANDKIKDFSKHIENNITSETIFKVDDYYVFGYYNKFEKIYYLRKFVD